MSAPAQRWNALVLAGDRGADDPIARHTATPCKALAMLHGVPMLSRVLDALRGSERIGAIHLCGPRAEHLALWPGLEAQIRAGELYWTAPQGSAASSAVAALAGLPDDVPVLVTTADHALLQTPTVDAFLARAEACEGADAVVGLAPLATVQAAFPGVRRTALRLRGGPYCGCNLFALRTARGRTAARFWQQLETVRKRPAHIARLLGVLAVTRYLTGTLDARQAFALLSARAGARIAMVELPIAQAAVDVDTVSDYLLAQRVLAARDGSSER